MKIHTALSTAMCLIIISTSFSSIEISALNFKEKINSAKTEVQNFCAKHEKILKRVGLGVAGTLALSIIIYAYPGVWNKLYTTIIKDFSEQCRFQKKINQSQSPRLSFGKPSW